MIKKAIKKVSTSAVSTDENVNVNVPEEEVKMVKKIKKINKPVDTVETPEVVEDEIVNETEVVEDENETSDDNDIEVTEDDFDTDDADISDDEIDDEDEEDDKSFDDEIDDEDEEELNDENNKSEESGKEKSEEKINNDESISSRPIKKKVVKKTVATPTVKKEKKEEEIRTPARELAIKAKLNNFGPAKGRRLFDERYADTETISTKSANKEENLSSFVERLIKNGADYIFEGCTFATEQRAIASVILESLEQAILDCIYNKGTGFAFLNGRIDGKLMEAKYYPPIVGSKNDKAVIKMEHHRLSLVNAEVDNSVGLVYKNENGSSELSIFVEKIDDNKFKVLEDGLYYKEGDLVDKEGLPIE